MQLLEHGIVQNSLPIGRIYTSADTTSYDVWIELVATSDTWECDPGTSPTFTFDPSYGLFNVDFWKNSGASTPFEVADALEIDVQFRKAQSSNSWVTDTTLIDYESGDLYQMNTTLYDYYFECVE